MHVCMYVCFLTLFCPASYQGQTEAVALLLLAHANTALETTVEHRICQVSTRDYSIVSLILR